MTTIQDTLRSFGITRCYKGFQYAAYAIQLAVEDESRLEAITKEIYEETAEHFGCNGAAVERSIRTVVDRAWKIDNRCSAKSPGIISNASRPHRSLSRLWRHIYCAHPTSFTVCFKYFAGMGLSSCQVIFMGREPVWVMYEAVPRQV